MAPSTPRKRQLTRDQRLRIKTLRDIGWTYDAIHAHVRHEGVMLYQIEHTCQHDHPTPQKRSGRPPVLTIEQKTELIAFVRQSKRTRRLPYLELAVHFDWPGIAEHAIQGCLEREGYKRYVARVKPPISEKNRKIRLEWAHEHLNWTREQWFTILWTDETWVTGGRHTKTWVTRLKGEALDDTCIVEKVSRPRGWMFWGCFNGLTKGPALFWGKKWGSINRVSYCEHIVPLIYDWLTANSELSFMQDGAPGHRAKATHEEFARRDIERKRIFWPPYSPDLNPIESIWDKMKDYIQAKFPFEKNKLTYAQLRNAVREAWDSISVEQLNEQISTMHQRCQDVIDANGKHTKW